MNLNFLEFEQPIAELEAKIDELRFIGDDADVNINEEVSKLEAKNKALTQSIFSNLTAWQISQLARHPQRPYTLDYVVRVFTDFQELHGDRCFADDRAIIGGVARLDGIPVMIIGQQKGRDTKEKLNRNFGMPRPEGYRKAMRLMKMAERFGLPLLTFIDTPGAYPGIGAEERGQSEAIARNLFVMSDLRIPVICTVIGEGGSGGALAIGIGDRVLMLHQAVPWHPPAPPHVEMPHASYHRVRFIAIVARRHELSHATVAVPVWAMRAVRSAADASAAAAHGAQLAAVVRRHRRCSG